MTFRSVASVSGAAALLFLLGGCGGPGAGRFASCGNGVINSGEQCDNGSANSDNGDCLSTCDLARCGDTFIDSEGTMVEQCDTFNLSFYDCTTLGFDRGTLTCSPNCTFDTSACGPRFTETPTLTPTPTSTPTVTPTATVPVVSPTITPTGPIPTATATPIVSCDSVTVTVRLVYDAGAVPELAGVVVDLNYPETEVSIPGSGGDESVTVRVTDISGAHGLAVIEDRDTNDDGQDDQLQNAYATTGNIPSGDFEQVVFDCTAGAPVPDVSAFACEVPDASDPQGFPVSGVGCEISLAIVLQATPTPAPRTATSTATATAPPPTATPVPTCAMLEVTVAVTYDVNAVPEVAGVEIDLNYPASVAIPGSGGDDSVAARVIDVSDAHGLPSISDRDSNADGEDDLLANVYVTTGNIAPGDFEQVHFDCVPAALIPAVTEFSCVVSDASDPQGFSLVGSVGCSVRITATDMLAGP